MSSDYGQVAALESNSRKGWTKLSSQLGEAVKKVHGMEIEGQERNNLELRIKPTRAEA